MGEAVTGIDEVLPSKIQSTKEEVPLKSQSMLQERLSRFLLPALLLGVTLTLAGNTFAGSSSTSPIAFASISAIDGTVQSGTPNVTSTLNTSTGLFEITITNVCFDRLDYTVVATVSGYNGWPTGAAFINTNDDGDSCHLTGKLYVQLLDVNGNIVQDDFQIVVFKGSKTDSVSRDFRESNGR
jgi:hypothetical protein